MEHLLKIFFNVNILTFDTKCIGVLFHGTFISQDDGPPQFTKRHSVATRVKLSQS